MAVTDGWRKIYKEAIGCRSPGSRKPIAVFAQSALSLEPDGPGAALLTAVQPQLAARGPVFALDVSEEDVDGFR